MATTCTYSTGSDTDCQPLCDAAAVNVITHTNGGVFHSAACTAHTRKIENQVWFCYVSTTKIGV